MIKKGYTGDGTHDIRRDHRSHENPVLINLAAHVRNYQHRGTNILSYQRLFSNDALSPRPSLTLGVKKRR